MRLLLTVVLCIAAPSCTSSEPGPADDGPAGEACAVPDVACPAEGTPVAGAPCDGALECPSVDARGAEWTYSCEEGQWVASGGCIFDEESQEELCAAPTLAERCLSPSTEVLEGAIVRLGSGDVSAPFASFGHDAWVDLIFGPQGGAMVSARLEIVGVDVPACVGVRTSVLSANAGEWDEPLVTEIPLAMHCDRSNPFFIVIPANCDEGETTMVIDVEVDGIGSTSASLRMPSQADDCG